MNRNRLLPFFPIVLAASISLRAGEDAKSAPPSDGTTLIVDLRTPPAEIFQYGSWQGKIAVTKSGLVMLGSQGAQGDGGIGCDLAPAIDGREVEYVEVGLGTLSGNEVPEITLALNDADGTQFTARVRVDQLVPGQPVWLRARRADFRINRPEPGADAKMDWSKIARWHLQGDWSKGKPLRIIFIALRVRK